MFFPTFIFGNFTGFTRSKMILPARKVQNFPPFSQFKSFGDRGMYFTHIPKLSKFTSYIVTKEISLQF